LLTSTRALLLSELSREPLAINLLPLHAARLALT